MNNFLTWLPVWNKLSSEHQSALAAAALQRSFAKGEVVHTAGECAGLLLVTSGRLRAATVSEDGRQITLYRLFERDMCLFSASCMMNSIQFDITITAEKDSTVLVIPTDLYKSIMAVSAPLANHTNEVMASRFSEVMWLIEQVMWKSFDKRLADFLLSEAALEDSAVLHITHEAIGAHLGNPREVVTRMLKYFQNEGMVKLSRGVIELTDEKKLRALTEQN